MVRSTKFALQKDVPALQHDEMDGIFGRCRQCQVFPLNVGMQVPGTFCIVEVQCLRRSMMSEQDDHLGRTALGETRCDGWAVVGLVWFDLGWWCLSHLSASSTIIIILMIRRWRWTREVEDSASRGTCPLGLSLCCLFFSSFGGQQFPGKSATSSRLLVIRSTPLPQLLLGTSNPLGPTISCARRISHSRWEKSLRRETLPERSYRTTNLRITLCFKQWRA